MLEKIGSSIVANANAGWITLIALFRDDLFVGFSVGIIITTIIIAFFLTEHPRMIPFVVRYTFPECFYKASDHFDENNIVCDLELVKFHKTYIRIRMIFASAITLFISITIAAVYLQR
jgi:hypothetical protein